MPDHRRALVPIEAWPYASPDVVLRGAPADLGLLSEALLYYDTVYLNVPTQLAFARLLLWATRDNSLDLLVRLLKDRTIVILDYAFFTAPIQKDGVASLWNVQDPLMMKKDSFSERFLDHADVTKVIDRRIRREVEFALRGRVLQEFADSYSPAIDAARTDLDSAERCTTIVQALVDEVYRACRRSDAPQIISSIERRGETRTVTWNFPLDELSRISDGKINAGGHLPFTAAAQANKFLLTSARHGCDLYLPSPMSTLLGHKLHDSASAAKIQGVISQLEAQVEFPDIRELVNTGHLSFKDIVQIRRKSAKFRTWLQSEAERDGDALVAYHHEVAKESGFVVAARRALKLFGALGGAAIGAAVETKFGGTQGAMVGALAGTGLGELSAVSASLAADWKPVVFGKWLEERVVSNARV
jgi:hypothetical protein